MKPIVKKKYKWCFIGQVKDKPTRENMLQEFRELDLPSFEHITEKWNDEQQLDVKKYHAILRDSVFVPCPSGWGGGIGLKDNFRLYECLEAGSIPIVEHDEHEYFDKFYPGHPFLKCPSDWKGVAKDVGELLLDLPRLQEYNNQVIDWWQQHKSALKKKINSLFALDGLHVPAPDNSLVSVVVPTIWRANKYFSKSLYYLERDSRVSEVIVINNAPEKTPTWINQFKKVKLLDQKENLYFNASVNLGVSLCNSDICCVINDDAYIDRNVFQFICSNINPNMGTIFINPRNIKGEGVPNGHLFDGSKFIKPEGLSAYNEFFKHGPGMFFVFNKHDFLPIPSELIHHCGDRFIFEANKLRGKQNYYLEGFCLTIPGNGSASAGDVSLNTIVDKDWEMRKKIMSDLSNYVK